LKIRLTKNLEPLRASALARLDEVMSDRLYAITSSPVAILRARKLAEAKRVLAGEGGAPLLTAEAFDQTFDVASLAATVVAKAATEAEVIAAIEAQRQRAQAAIRSAPNPAAIDAVLLELELPR
jgi:hypothetical protein